MELLTPSSSAASRIKVRYTPINGDWFIENKSCLLYTSKDSKGIAVFDPKGRRNTLKYYFDISDTHEDVYKRQVLNDEIHAVELVYAGQNMAVTETETSFYNERQRVEIDLVKSLETDEALSLIHI